MGYPRVAHSHPQFIFLFFTDQFLIIFYSFFSLIFIFICFIFFCTLIVHLGSDVVVGLYRAEGRHVHNSRFSKGIYIFFSLHYNQVTGCIDAWGKSTAIGYLAYQNAIFPSSSTPTRGKAATYLQVLLIDLFPPPHSPPLIPSIYADEEKNVSKSSPGQVS